MRAVEHGVGVSTGSSRYLRTHRGRERPIDDRSGHARDAIDSNLRYQGGYGVESQLKCRHSIAPLDRNVIGSCGRIVSGSNKPNDPTPVWETISSVVEPKLLKPELQLPRVYRGRGKSLTKHVKIRCHQDPEIDGP
jgi:hypothetical protein